jgi:hypothetical protein
MREPLPEGGGFCIFPSVSQTVVPLSDCTSDVRQSQTTAYSRVQYGKSFGEVHGVLAIFQELVSPTHVVSFRLNFILYNAPDSENFTVARDHVTLCAF